MLITITVVKKNREVVRGCHGCRFADFGFPIEDFHSQIIKVFHDTLGGVTGLQSLL
jgi:hypothetical protein